MWPVFYAFLRNNSRIIVLPAAVAFGALGYCLENMISSKHTPGTESVIKQRAERLTRDLDQLAVKDAQYENVLERK